MLTTDQAKQIFDELANAKALLSEIIDAYGYRWHHGEGVFVREDQPELIQRAMDIVCGDKPQKTPLDCPDCNCRLIVSISAPGTHNHFSCPGCGYSHNEAINGS